jgi:hypothetical protein
MDHALKELQRYLFTLKLHALVDAMSHLSRGGLMYITQLGTILCSKNPLSAFLVTHPMPRSHHMLKSIKCNKFW